MHVQGGCLQGGYHSGGVSSSNVDVDVLVHSPTNIRRATLESWLDPALHPQIVKIEWSTVRTRQGKPYMRDPTVQKFLEQTTLGLPMPGKRPRVYPAGPSYVSPKQAGRKSGWRKPLPGNAADASGPADAAGPSAAEADATTCTAQHHSGLPAAGAEPASAGASADAALGLGPWGGSGRGRGRGRGGGPSVAAFPQAQHKVCLIHVL